jgi:hypothetical protein
MSIICNDEIKINDPSIKTLMDLKKKDYKKGVNNLI